MLPTIPDTVPGLRKESAKSLCGRCPKCGGDDRFVVRDGRFWCRQCNRRGGDIVDFHKWKDGLELKDLFKKYLPNEKEGFIATYDYQDIDGNLHYQVCRKSNKEFLQRRPDGNGGWIWNMEGIEPTLYHLPEVIRADEVIIVEGEKDANDLQAIGLTATTSPMGAGNWKDHYTDDLKGKNIILIPDNDDEGRKHMAKVAESLNGHVASLKWLDLPGLPDKGDVSDFISTFTDKAEAAERLSIMIENAAPYRPNPTKDGPEPSKTRTNTDVSARVREYLLDEFDGGVFKVGDVKRDLGLTDQQYTVARNTIKRMKDQGLIQKHGHTIGCYRVVARKKNKISWDAVEAKPSGLRLPGDLHNIVTTREGDVICFTGYKNQNKTAMAIETVRLNLDQFEIHFFITEYQARMKRRLLDFGIDLKHPNLNCYPIERGDYIPDKIESGKGKGGLRYIEKSDKRFFLEHDVLDYVWKRYRDKYSQ